MPELAESWQQTDDLTYVFHLHKGVRFHDVPPVSGRELTSADVKYSIERQMTDQPGKFQHAYFFLGKLASIDTPDKYTVVFKTQEPYAPFMNYIANPWTVIVAREVVEKYGDLQKHAIGTGPFIMKDYRRDQEATFVKNPHYFKQGLPYLDEVRLQYVIDPAAATAAFRGQQTDISASQNSPMWILSKPPTLGSVSHKSSVCFLSCCGPSLTTSSARTNHRSAPRKCDRQYRLPSSPRTIFRSRAVAGACRWWGRFRLIANPGPYLRRIGRNITRTKPNNCWPKPVIPMALQWSSSLAVQGIMSRMPRSSKISSPGRHHRQYQTDGDGPVL